MVFKREINRKSANNNNQLINHSHIQWNYRCGIYARWVICEYIWIFLSLTHTRLNSYTIARPHLRIRTLLQESIQPSIKFYLHYVLFKKFLCNNLSLFLSYFLFPHNRWSQIIVFDIACMHKWFWICAVFAYVCAFI